MQGFLLGEKGEAWGDGDFLKGFWWNQLSVEWEEGEEGQKKDAHHDLVPRLMVEIGRLLRAVLTSEV